MTKITNTYIRDKYNLADEAKDTRYMKELGTIDLRFDDISKKEFIDKLINTIENLPEEDFRVKTNQDDYYDVDVHTMSVIKYRKETESEVIERLKKEERAQRKQNKKILDAKKLLGID